MKAEFKRFGLEKFGGLTGCLEIVGGIGLIIGFWVPVLLTLASLGLFLLMVLGFGVRLKMRDSLVLTLPSFFLYVAQSLHILVCWIKLFLNTMSIGDVFFEGRSTFFKLRSEYHTSYRNIDREAKVIFIVLNIFLIYVNNR